jgi:hypothetical protein
MAQLPLAPFPHPRRGPVGRPGPRSPPFGAGGDTATGDPLSQKGACLFFHELSYRLLLERAPIVREEMRDT